MRFRLRAFVWHLSASACMALFAVLVVFGVWYPFPLSNAVGVTSIFLLLLVVDVSLGPLLTLIVAKEGKKSLRFDLGIVIAIQLGAFLYGMYVVAEGRPVWFVFNKDRFDLVQAYELRHQYAEQAPEEYKSAGLLGPRWVAAHSPIDTEQLNQLIEESLNSGPDLPQRPDLYVEYSSAVAEIREAAKPLLELSKYNDKDSVAEVLTEWPEATAYLPLMARKTQMVVLITKDSGKVVSVVPLKPW